MPTICHISTVHPADDVRIFFRECSSLAAIGYDVNLVVVADADEVKNGVRIRALRPIKNRFWRILLLPWLALGKALKTKADIFHLHDPELIFIGFILRWLLGRAVVFDVHETFTRQIMSKAYLPYRLRKATGFLYSIIESIFISGQQIIVANPSSLADYPKRAYLVQNYPLIVDDFQVGPTKSRDNNRASLVYLGAVEEIRGAMIYLDLAQRLKASGYKFKLTIIGQYSPLLGHKMLDFIHAKKIEDCVELTGRVPWDQAMAGVAQADLGLCILLPEPNYTSCFATKILEYMMAGVPVLCSDFELWRPYVAGVDSGRMVDPHNIEQIAEVCGQMLDDPAKLKKMAHNGRQAVQEKFNWNNEFQNLLKCYDSILRPKK